MLIYADEMCSSRNATCPSVVLDAEVGLYLEEMLWIRSWAAEQGIKIKYSDTLLLTSYRFIFFQTLDGSYLCYCLGVVVTSFMAVHVFHAKWQFLMTLQHLCCLCEVLEAADSVSIPLLSHYS